MIFRRQRHPESESRMQVHTRSKTLALLLALGLGLAACASEGGDTSTTAGGDTGTTTEGDTGTTAGGDGEGAALNVWVTRDYYIPPDDFASFEAANPGVTVEWNLQANDDILQQFLRMRDAGQPLPDVLGAEDAFLIQNYVEAELVGSHDEIAANWEAENPEQYELLLPLVWDETAIDGVKYGASITANFDILYYNTEWFAEAGVEAPFETLDDVLDAMRAMKTARPDSIPMTVQARAGDGVTATVVQIFNVSVVGCRVANLKDIAHRPHEVGELLVLARAGQGITLVEAAKRWVGAPVGVRRLRAEERRRHQPDEHVASLHRPVPTAI